MAKEPTVDDTIRAILDVCRVCNVRVGHTIPTGPVVSRLAHTGKFTGPELADAEKEMVSRGWLEENEHGSFAFTSAGYAAI